MPQPAPIIPSYQLNDVAILLDTSGSIDYDTFYFVKVFVEVLANAVTAYSSNRLVFITYSDYPTTIIDKTNTLGREEISSTILNTPWKGGGTATFWGIDLAVQELISSPRRQTPLNIIIFTSGGSIYPEYIIDSVEWAAREGIRTFSVGLAPFINQQELLAIAGNDPNRVFTEENFDSLIELLAPLKL